LRNPRPDTLLPVNQNVQKLVGATAPKVYLILGVMVSEVRLTTKFFGSLTTPVVAPNDKTKSTFPLITFAFILTLATGFVKERIFLI